MLCRIAGKSKADRFPGTLGCVRSLNDVIWAPALEIILIEFLKELALFLFSFGFCFARSRQDPSSLLMFISETYVEVTAKGVKAWIL